jgi:hypothetical protein
MKILSLISYGLLSIVLSFPAVSSASILMTTGGTVVPNEGMVTNQTGVTTINFDNDVLPSNFTLGNSGLANIVVGTTPYFVEPQNDTSDYLTTGTSFVTINLAATPVNYFGLDWGTVDTYNTIAFTEANGTVDTFTGTQAAAAANIPANGTTDAYVNFLANPGTTLKSVTLSSSNFAFESDNISYGNVAATPEPATWSMLAAGLGVAGLLIRRRNKLAA